MDELHNIANAPSSRQQGFLTVLKYLTNELEISIVCAGTDEALSAMRADRQMESRFEVFELPLWRQDEAYLRLLDSFEYRLPLHQASALASPETASLILSLGKGTFGGILATVTRAAVAAVTTKEERITRDLILGIDPEPDTSAERRVS